MNSHSIPPEIIKYQNFWAKFLNANLKVREVMIDLIKQEKELLGISEDWRLTFNFSDDYEAKIIKQAKNLTSRIVDIASKKFSGKSQKLDIDVRNYIEKFVEDSRDTKFENMKFHNFNTVDLWIQLFEDFGNGAGETIGYKQDAEQLIKLLGINSDDDVNTIGGYVVLERSMWIDSTHKKFFKTNQYSYSCREEMLKVLSSFENFMIWAGKPELKNAFYTMKQIFTSSNDIVSRQKYVISDEFHFITLLNKVEIRIGHALALQFRQFLSEFGQIKTN